MNAPQVSQSTQDIMWAATRRRPGATQTTPRLLRLVVLLFMLAAILGLGAARQADAAEQVPFTGTFTTSGVATPCGPMTLCISVRGSGEATHLGRTQMTKSVVLHLTFEPCPGGTVNHYTVEQTLTAANGDTLTMSGSGTSCSGPGGLVATGTFSVTDGTGRFSGASGTITEHVVRVGPPPAPETVTLSGTISSPGSLK